PDFVHTYHFYGIYLTAMGRFPEALPKLRRAVDLDPLSLPARASLGFCCYLSRHYEEGIAELGKLLDMDPDFAVAHNLLSFIHAQKGMWDEAIAAQQRAVDLSARDPFRVASLGVCLADSGRRAEAEAIRDELTAGSRQRYVSPVSMAYLRAALGDLDGAM